VVAVVVIAAGRPRRTGSERGIGWAAAGVALVLLGTTAVGVLHVVVWNPIAKVPGLALDEIYTALAAAGETPSNVVLAVWAAGGIASAVAILVAASPIPRMRARFSTRR